MGLDKDIVGVEKATPLKKKSCFPRARARA